MPAASYVRSYERLMEGAADLPWGPAGVSMLEAAVSLADLNGDVPRGYAARLELTAAAEHSGAPEKALAAFAWMLAQADRQPGVFDEESTLWAYKWIAAKLPRFPSVGRDTIERTVVDLEDRFARFGAGRKAGLKLRWRIATVLGDLDAAVGWLEEWRVLPRDALSDCRACDVAEEVELHVARLDFDRAFRAARPVVSERYTCAEVPHMTLALLLLPLLRTGRDAVARDHHQRGYRLVQRNPAFLRPVGEHIGYLALSGRESEAMKLLERHLPWDVSATDQWHRFHFELSARLALVLAARKQHGGQIRLPVDTAAELGGGRVSTEVVAEWLGRRLADLALRYDARNGQPYASGLVREYEMLAGPA